MHVPFWLRPIADRLKCTHLQRARQRPAFRPRLEVLEDRAIPAAFSVTRVDDSGAGSLRQAILDANAATGADTIQFAIPNVLQSPGGWWTIRPLSALPGLDDSDTIDGWSQAGAGPGLAPRIFIDGTNAGIGSGVELGSNCTVRGLAVGNFAVSASEGIALDGTHNAVVGCYVGLDPTGTTAAPNLYGISDLGGSTTIGGSGRYEGNVISGNIKANVFGGNGALIRGNFIGTNAAGTAAISGSASFGIQGVDGTIADNLISGNGDVGISVLGANHLIIVGNLIGTDLTGMHAIGNGPSGIDVQAGSDIVIGGTDPASRNVISANGGGILIQSPGVVMQGNYIGTDLAGASIPGNAGAGIIALGDGTIIGGSAAGAGNLIAGNGANGNGGIYLASSNNLVQGNVIRDNAGAGVFIGKSGQGVGNTVSQNAIYGNEPIPGRSGLGVDILVNDFDSGGVTLNNSVGHDGPNHFQNFPVLSAAHCGEATGTLSSAPNSTFRIEFFANTQADPSGYGEGEQYIGFLDVTSDAAGNASFTAPLAVLLGGEYLSAAATNLATGDTSEFSADVFVEPPPVAVASGPSAGVRGQSLTFILTATGSPGPFTFQIDWDGNGTVDQTVTGASGFALAHTYTSSGVDTVRVSATDPDGCTSPVATVSVAIQAALVEPDPTNAGQQALFVGGTTGNDVILLLPTCNNGVEVWINCSSYGTFQPDGRVIAYGQAGNDGISALGLGRPTMLFGGAGNDTILGASSINMLVGGDGNDVLVGGNNRNVLIGGAGSDLLLGGTGDDLLVAGSTSFDTDAAALSAIAAEWSSGRDYATRVANIAGTGSGAGFAGRLNGNVFLRVTADVTTTTVYDDGAADLLAGSAGRDWYFANLAGGGIRDVVLDFGSGEVTIDLSWLPPH